MSHHPDPEVHASWTCLWSSCEFFPEEQEGITCAYCGRSIGEYREEGVESVDICWINKKSLERIDITAWQKNVLLRYDDIYLCGRCGMPLQNMGWSFFLDSTELPWDVRLSWQRTALQLLAAKLLTVQDHHQYEDETGFRSPGYKKDTRSPLPGSLAGDALDQMPKAMSQADTSESASSA